MSRAVRKRKPDTSIRSRLILYLALSSLEAVLNPAIRSSPYPQMIIAAKIMNIVDITMITITDRIFCSSQNYKKYLGIM